MKSVKQETLSGVKWTAIEKFSVQGIQFLLGLIMARLLSPSDYGTVGMLAIFFAVSQTFIDSGFGNALVRKIDRTETDFSTVFYFNIVVSVACYILLFTIAPWVGSFFNMSILCPILRVQSINLILNSMMGIQVAKLTIDINFKALAKRSLWSSIVSGVFGIILAYNGFGVWALVYQSILSTFINLVFIWIYCKWKPRREFSWQSFRELFSYGSKLLLSGLLNTIYVNLTPIIIGKYFSPRDLGFYSRGTHLARYPGDNINGVLQRVTFPVFAKLQNDDEHLIHAYRKYISITSMCIFYGCVLMASIGKPLVLLLLSSKWAEAIIYLQIFSFSIMFDHINSINLNLLQVKGRSDLFLRLEIIKKTISTIILFASIPFGVIGICISKVIYTQIAVFINTYYTGKLFHLGYIDQFRDFGGYLILSIIACVPAYLLTFLDIPYIVTLILGASTSTILYFIFLRKNKYMHEVLETIKSKLHF
ncbi:lipopolysaccharide biosynthesis protein [Prevotella sp. PCHR]|uniref:Lipopolysaccharide biosynthesis protein n=1 Tax=Xylanibacter caecicola TaxID=2736294 RepID=A0ABX2B425_9BACT|nr:lipopolysaccharide biosynthesis protein [Xylanibacter caecicola]NPE25742.1 lipopolysaccharide biosynthesis protein [Xylanibacter caecicola]